VRGVLRGKRSGVGGGRREGNAKKNSCAERVQHRCANAAGLDVGARARLSRGHVMLRGTNSACHREAGKLRTETQGGPGRELSQQLVAPAATVAGGRPTQRRFAESTSTHGGRRRASHRQGARHLRLHERKTSARCRGREERGEVALLVLHVTAALAEELSWRLPGRVVRRSHCVSR